MTQAPTEVQQTSPQKNRPELTTYRFLDDIATADIAFLACGQTLEETFIAAADATMNVMIEELASIRNVEKRALELSNDSLDMLLFNFLRELIYYKDAEQLLLRVKTVNTERSARNTVSAGEKGWPLGS
jgi:SHS2 domain-containing protein